MSEHPHYQHDPLCDDVELRQRNTVWPDTMRNGMIVDGYLWKGNPKAPLVQRIGAGVFGIAFLMFAVMLGYMAARASLWPLYLLAAACAYLGSRL